MSKQRWFGRSILLMAVLGGSVAVLAQDQPQPLPPNGAPAQAPQFAQADLDTLVAPIALYPDSLLSQILMASTYPLEVVQAERFVTANPNLDGNTFADALAQQNWDPSVKSLTNFPSVLQMMDDKLDWTVQLGNAFLAQQQDVMDSVQRLRAQAQAAGNLQTNQQQRIQYVQPDQVVGTPPPATQYIEIDNVDPGYVYVPVYDPFIVFGTWRYQNRRPWFWHPREYVPTRGIWYGPRCQEGPAWGYAWGRPDWRRRDIDIDIHRHEKIDIHVKREEVIRHESVQLQNGRGEWQHNPNHRDGIVYGDTRTAERFGGRAPDADVRAREPYRGRTDDVRNAPDVRQPVAQQPDKRQTDKPQGQGREAEVRQKANQDADRPQGDVRTRDNTSPQQKTQEKNQEKSQDKPADKTPDRKLPPVEPVQPAPAPKAKASPEPDRPTNPRAVPHERDPNERGGDVRTDSERGRESRSAPKASPAPASPPPAPSAPPAKADPHPGSFGGSNAPAATPKGGGSSGGSSGRGSSSGSSSGGGGKGGGSSGGGGSARH